MSPSAHETLDSLKARGWSVVRMARELHVSRAGVYRVFEGEFKCSAVRDRITEIMTERELELMGWQRRVEESETLQLIRKARNLFELFLGLERRITKLETGGRQPATEIEKLLEQANGICFLAAELERQLQSIEECG